MLTTIAINYTNQLIITKEVQRWIEGIFSGLRFGAVP
jgi:hypothetical protein